jgi:hypothetical protein
MRAEKRRKEEFQYVRDETPLNWTISIHCKPEASTLEIAFFALQS